MPLKYIGVVGSRRRDTETDYKLVRKALLAMYKPGDVIVSGHCRQGADAFAEVICSELRVQPLLFIPNKDALDPDLLRVKPRAAYATELSAEVVNVNSHGYMLGEVTVSASRSAEV